MLRGLLGDRDAAAVQAETPERLAALIRGAGPNLRTRPAQGEWSAVEVLGHNEYGVLTPVGDASAFAAAVEALLDDPVRRLELSTRGRTRARDFDRRRVGPAYEDLFARIAGRSPAGVSARSDTGAANSVVKLRRVMTGQVYQEKRQVKRRRPQAAAVSLRGTP